MTRSVVWGFSDSSEATVTNDAVINGQVLAVSRGSSTITATAENITGSATLAFANWTTQTVNLGSYLESAVWSGTQVVVVGTGNRIFTSQNGVVWTRQGAGLTTADLLGVFVLIPVGIYNSYYQ